MATEDFWTGFESAGEASPSLESLVNTLNPSQRAAVEKVEGPLLILAGPGSGKTRVITHRIAYMIASGIPSYQIVALTFTNKAANEMRLRLESLAPDHMAWTGTFHKFCARTLRMHASMVGLAENFTIYDTGDSKKILKQAIANLEVDLRHYSPESMIHHVSSVKNRGVLADEYEPRPGIPLEAILARLYPEYQRLLRDANAVDFDDLLLYAVELFRDNPEIRQAYDEKYAYFMVDEYQDTNTAQYKLIRLLNYNLKNLAVTGDPDQSIYGWRGADISNILRFEEDFPGVQIVRLEQNYRSTKAILRVADQLIENNLHRKHKALHTDNAEGKRVRLVAFPSPQDEATDIADTIALALRRGTRTPNDFAIFYRTNWLSRALEHALRLADVPYQVVNGHEFYQRKEIKDVIGYLHLLNNPRDTIAFERVINVPPRKLGKVTISRVRNFAMQHHCSMLESARRCPENEAIKNAPASKIKKFVDMYDELVKVSHGNIESIIKAVLDATGYRDWLTEDGSEEGFERARNIDELIVAAREFDNEHPDDCSLDRYLEQAALVSDTDAYDSNAEFVTLMTLHASKGLEFPVVHLIGAEDGILPHERSNSDDKEIEEERRLMFVGITRAKEELQISRSLSRFRKGGMWPAIASRFLMELPREEMDIFEPGGFGRRGGGQGNNAWSSNDATDLDDLFDEQFEEGFEKEYRSKEVDEPDEISFDVESLEAEDDAPASENRGCERPVIERPGKEQPEFGQSEVGRSGKQGLAAFPQLLTGSEIAARQKEQGNGTSPDRYQVGQVVEHPEYGMGRIETISGRGIKRMATIDFSKVGSKTFRLAFCGLRIVS